MDFECHRDYLFIYLLQSESSLLSKDLLHRHLLHRQGRSCLQVRDNIIWLSIKGLIYNPKLQNYLLFFSGFIIASYFI